jgi:hypothetical protein
MIKTSEVLGTGVILVACLQAGRVWGSVTINALALGKDMAGATITVSYQKMMGGACLNDPASMDTKMIQAAGNNGIADSPRFHFNVTGDQNTFETIWEINNLNSARR